MLSSLVILVLILGIAKAEHDEPNLIIENFVDSQNDVQNSKFECEQLGRFADPDDCTQYFECLPDLENSGLKAYLKPCLSGGFHAKLGACVKLSKLENCFPKRTGKATIYNPEYDHLCIDGDNFICANCYTNVHCIEGEAHIESCSDDSPISYCRHDQDTGFNGGVCYPGNFDSCMCISSGPPRSESILEESKYLSIKETSTSDDVVREARQGGSLQYEIDYYSSNQFFHCPVGQSIDGHPELFQCPTNEKFIPQLQFCLNEDASPSFQCYKNGKFPLPNSCTSYYQCTETSTGYITTFGSCDGTDYFYPPTEQCIDPCPWNYGEEFVCQSEGRFPDHFDCNVFHECKSEGGGSFIHKQYSCPTAMDWEPILDKKAALREPRGKIGGSTVLDYVGGTCISIKDSSCQATETPYCSTAPSCGS